MRCTQVPLLGTAWTIACQAPLSVGFTRQEYWRGLPCLTSPHFAISPVLGLADNPFLVDSSGSSHGNNVPSLLHQSLHCFPQISAEADTSLLWRIQCCVSFHPLIFWNLRGYLILQFCRLCVLNVAILIALCVCLWGDFRKFKNVCNLHN